MAGVTALLVATPGGHIEELRLLAPRLGVDTSTALWVTSRTAHTTSLLAEDEAAGRVHWVPHVGSGDIQGALRGLPRAVALHRRLRPQVLVSTGAAAAAPHLVAAALYRCPIWYVESATRREGPSATGRLARRLPRTTLYAQGEGWGDPSWRPIDDVFSAFEVQPREVPVRVRRALVSLGTERFPFERAVRAAERVLEGCEVVWQTGSTRVERDGVTLPQWLPAAELHEVCRDGDVIITHAGIGSALMALAAGKVPVVLPRRAGSGEHIDDHQVEAASMLAGRGLAISVDADDLEWGHIEAASRLTVRPA